MTTFKKQYINKVREVYTDEIKRCFAPGNNNQFQTGDKNHL